MIAAVALTVIMSLAAIQPASAADREATGGRRIVMLGDSLTDGYGLPRSSAYPALVGEKLRAGGYNFEVVNAGVTGDTTADGLRRLPQHLHQRVDVLVLALGINDAFRGVPIDEMRANLQAIIDRTRARHPKVALVIAGMQLPLNGAEGYMRAFGEMYGELADNNRAVLIPYLLAGVGGDPTLNQADRIHPNAAGQRVLAENVWRTLEPVLRKSPPKPAPPAN